MGREQLDISGKKGERTSIEQNLYFSFAAQPEIKIKERLRSYIYADRSKLIKSCLEN
jgi:hypothetical protein